VYVFEYRPKPGGRSTPKRRITIGPHGSWTPKAARDEAKRLLGIIAQGEDPAAANAAHRAAAAVNDLAARFLAEHAAAKRKPATARQYRRLVAKFIAPAIGRRKVADVTRQDVMRLHNGMRDTPYQANRVLALVSTLFSFAETTGERAVGSNPAQGVERYPEEARERMLSGAELSLLGEALREGEALGARLEPVRRRLAEARRRYTAARAINDRRAGGAARRQLEQLRAQLRELDAAVVPPQAVACMRLLLFTGARLGEVLTLQWHHVDMQRGEARLEDSKTGRKTLHLPSPALDVLAGLPRIGDNPYLIVGERPGRHFVGIQRPWQRIRNAAAVKAWAASSDTRIAALVRQLEHKLGRAPTAAECQRAAAAAKVDLPASFTSLRLHDLRHAYASVAASAGLGLPIIGKLLGHTQPVTTARYAHLASDPLKAAAEAIAGSIAASVYGTARKKAGR
jgi:integrase